MLVKEMISIWDSAIDLLGQYPGTMLITTLCVLVTLHYFQMLQKKRGMPPGPISLPLIGSAYVFLGKPEKEFPFILNDLQKKYGDIYTLQKTNGECLLVLTDIKEIRKTFATNDVAGRPQDNRTNILYRSTTARGMVFSANDHQLKLQKQTSMSVLRNLGYGKRSIEYLMIKEANHLKEALKDIDRKPFDPKNLIVSAVTNVICSLVFGKTFQYNDEEFMKVKTCSDQLFEFLSKDRMGDTLWFYNYLPSTRREIAKFNAEFEYFHQFIENSILETKKRLNDIAVAEDFITGYLKEVNTSNGKLEDRSHEMVIDFFNAGSETTTTTLRWILYYMAKYPDVQEKARAELESVLGKGQLPMLKDKESLPYINAIITEVLRVSPTAVGSLAHRTTTDTVIGGYNIPKGTEVQAIFVSTLWNPELFPDPEVLKPERHMDSNGKFLRNDNITPFGTGKRSCFGELLARQELFIFFTHLIQNFEFKVPPGEPLPDQRGDWFVTYQPQPYKIIALPLE